MNIQDLSLFEFIVAIIVVLVLILSIAKMNLDNKNVIDEVNFEMAKQNFGQNIALMRAQWLIEGRPASIAFNFYADRDTISETRDFALSTMGWPKVEQSCRALWIKSNNLDASEDLTHYILIKNLSKKMNDIECQFCDAGNDDSCIAYSSHYGMKTTQ